MEWHRRFHLGNLQNSILASQLIKPQSLLIILGLLSSALSAATLNPTGRDIELSTLLRIADSVIGEAQLTLTANDDLQLPKEETLQLLSSALAPIAIKALDKSSDRDTLTTADFEKAGLTLTFDMGTLECVLTVPKALLKVRDLSLASSRTSKKYYEPSTLNGFANVSASTTQNQAKGDFAETQTNTRYRLDAVLNYRSMTLELESQYKDDSNQEARYVREGSRLNIDFPSQGSRLVLGDMYNSGRILQDAVNVVGIGITRDFTLIPTRNARPAATQSFTLQRTSTVDVVLDGIIVQRLTLAAGNYNLNDIPLAQGNNDIELIITDSSGREETIQFSVATGYDLLATGEWEYSLLAGVPSTSNYEGLEYDHDQAVIHGYLDVGLAPWLTLGINGQRLEDDHLGNVTQVGTSALVASSIGITELLLSYSDHTLYEDGIGARLAFDAILDQFENVRPQFNFIYDYLSENYAGVGDIDTQQDSLNSTEHSLSTFLSFNLSPDYRLSLSGTYHLGHDSADDFWSISPSLSGSWLGTPTTWSVRLGYRDERDQSNDVTASVTISIPLSRATRLVTRYDSSNDRFLADLSYRNAIGNTGGVSAFASVETERDTDVSADIGVNYTANRMQIIADHTTRYDDISGSNRNHNTRLQVESAIAFSGNAVAVGRPVGDSFAIISAHDSLKENNIAIDPLRNSEYARVHSDNMGNILVPDLVDYSEQLISFDVENLPPGYDLGEGVFAVKPGYKQGYQLQVGTDAALTVLGSLIDKRTQQPIPLMSGVAHPIDNPDITHEFFTNRAGMFAITGVQAKTYKLILNTPDQDEITIKLDDYEGVLIRLGELYVE